MLRAWKLYQSVSTSVPSTTRYPILVKRSTISSSAVVVWRQAARPVRPPIQARLLPFHRGLAREAKSEPEPVVDLGGGGSAERLRHAARHEQADLAPGAGAGRPGSEQAVGIALGQVRPRPEHLNV